MKQIVAFLFIILEVLFFAWLGLWVGFVGGVVQFIESIKMDDIPAMGIAMALFRFFILPTISFWIGAIVVSITIAVAED